MDEKITTKIQTLGLGTENRHGKKCCTYSVLRNIVNISSFFHNKKRETFTSSGTICNHAMRKISSHGSVPFLGHTASQNKAMGVLGRV